MNCVGSTHSSKGPSFLLLVLYNLDMSFGTMIQVNLPAEDIRAASLTNTRSIPSTSLP